MSGHQWFEYQAFPLLYVCCRHKCHSMKLSSFYVPLGLHSNYPKPKKIYNLSLVSHQ